MWRHVLYRLSWCIIHRFHTKGNTTTKDIMYSGLSILPKLSLLFSLRELRNIQRHKEVDRRGSFIHSPSSTGRLEVSGYIYIILVHEEWGLTRCTTMWRNPWKKRAPQGHSLPTQHQREWQRASRKEPGRMKPKGRRWCCRPFRQSQHTRGHPSPTCAPTKG